MAVFSEVLVVLCFNKSVVGVFSCVNLDVLRCCLHVCKNALSVFKTVQLIVFA